MIQASHIESGVQRSGSDNFDKALVGAIFCEGSPGRGSPGRISVPWLSDIAITLKRTSL